MNLPLSWLKQFVKIDKTPEQIAERLTLSGSEVEKIIRHDEGLSKIVVGQIKEIKPHPDADKLCLPKVDIAKNKLLEIVCGVSNIKPGDKVPVVLAGGSVVGIPKVEKRKIRGIASDGMLCSERELGIGDDHTGIFILPSSVKVGEDVVKLLELDEPVLELEITPNRADCFSVRGLAREVAALSGLRVKRNELRVKEGSKKASSVLSVDVKDKELCPKYTARVIENVTVKPSPLWLQNRLRQVDIKPINNIVDVTNYVMMELGQPLHAFGIEADRRGLQRGLTRIVVRRAKKGEKLLALDGNTYNLNDTMLAITDGEKPIAIAGVMGGEESGVTAGTKTVILEAAVFNPVSIRKTSRALGLRSESSMRFEKGVDFDAVEDAITRAAALLADLSGGTVLRGMVSVSTKPKAPEAIKLPVSEVARLLGVDVAAAKIKSILKSLGFEVSGSSKTFSVKVPSWRAHDVSQAADLVEEVGRILDYNTLPKTLPSAIMQSPEPDSLHQLRRNWRQYLIASGYSEILTYSFYDETSVGGSGFSKADHILLTNPVNGDYPYLRTSMLPWMLQKLSQNSSLLSRDVFQLFEIGKVFNKSRGEFWEASVGLIDASASDEELFRRLRGLVEGFIGCPVNVIKDAAGYSMSLGKSRLALARVFRQGEAPGLRFRTSCAVLLLEIEQLAKARQSERVTFKPLPYYPVVERDLAMIVPEGVKYIKIEEVMKDFDPLLKKVELFDVYHGLGEGMSLAFRLTFGSTDRTLESSEVDDIMGRLKQQLAKKFMLSFR